MPAWGSRRRDPVALLIAATAMMAALTGCMTESDDQDDQADGDGAAMRTYDDGRWGGADHLLLMDDTVAVQHLGCLSFTPVAGAFRCATWGLPDGQIIPPGADVLYVEVDLSRMVNPTGYWRIEIDQTAGRDEDMDGDDLPGPVANWTFPLEPRDWDRADAQRSAMGMYLQALGDVPAAGIGFDFDVRVGVIRLADGTRE